MRVELHLFGEDFYPSKLDILETRVSIDRDSIGEKGRYRGVPVPAGYCYIKCPENLHHNDRIVWMCNYLLEKREYFTQSGCTSMTLWIYWEGLQGNMYFRKEEIEAIAKCDIGVNIDYIQLKSDEIIIPDSMKYLKDKK